MKSFMNGRDAVVTDAIDGFLAGAGGLKLARLDAYPDIKVVLRSDWDRARVALVSGGGSGHEPAHAGFVGEGLLTAAVCGEVFASPSVDAVLSAILAVTGEPGCLLIVKNYTGDRLNFGLAAERARVLGLAVEMVVVGDDVAIPDAAQPRGIAGTLLVHKLAGAAAASGASLSEVKARAEDAAANLRSLGLSLTTCAVPGAEREERIPADKAELGLGIHGEPGRETIAFEEADRLVARVAEQIEARLSAEDRIALMVNSLGGVSPLEMAIVMGAVARAPIAGRIDLVVGPEPLMTSLDMRGFSLTALTLDEARRTALSAPATSAAWRPARPFEATRLVDAPAIDDGPDSAPSDDPVVRKALTVGTARLKEIADEIDALDAKVGDGDAGGTFAAAASAVESRIDRLPMADGSALLGAIGHMLSRVAGGSSGVLLATFFTAAGAAFKNDPSWAGAFREGLARMTRYGGATVGDRTMIDALDPAIEAFARTGSLRDAAVAARKGADSTKAMATAKAGRSAYVPSAALSGVPDPGAEAVARLIERLAEAFAD
ncbi:dihydroxyacetone kinase subunit DhaK [Chenggangzhangella methanolivorans]|uniref:Dihydroxyacetone kinase subunit DhaK n=1 Tax=Chenggangzhangella methanolivorans TaxID=1437009 RepID=A0A9E6R9E1_9HYPH|nr:dihydroxyacetone kinase subunit DhaK [Chenggangzhangella methanolivorans]QZN99729.1 dihydroxyacetone kinase subunit DhaK [Chenggangzhangella methanolivorans]